MKRFPYLFAFFWGIFWAGLLQFTRWGRWLAIRRTYWTVVIGVGVDGLLLLPLVPFRDWLRMALIVALSSVGIIGRSLLNELREEADVIRAARGR
jgi:hypothetical protein